MNLAELFITLALILLAFTICQALQTNTVEMRNMAFNPPAISVSMSLIVA